MENRDLLFRRGRQKEGQCPRGCLVTSHSVIWPNTQLCDRDHMLCKMGPITIRVHLGQHTCWTMKIRMEVGRRGKVTQESITKDMMRMEG